MPTFADIHKQMGIKSPIVDQLLRPDGVLLTRENLVFKNGIPYLIDPETGVEHHITIHIKLNNWLPLDQFTGLMNRFGLGWEDSRKIHLYNCKIIREKRKNGEIFKYHASQRQDNTRRVKAADGEGDVPLKVCGFCLKSLALSSASFKSNDFDFPAFFNRHKPTFSKDEVQSDKLPADDYPSNWSQVSRREKEAVRFECQCCGVNLTESTKLLATHHKNKRKAEIDSENLIVLCDNCHKMQPAHGHMGDPTQEIRDIRRSQNLEPICPNCGG